MNSKTTVGLAIALVLAVAGVWWAESSRQAESAKPAAGPKALFEPAPGEITGCEIVQAGPGAPFKFELQKDKWQMTAPTSGPAEHYVVNNAVTKIKDLKYVKAYPASDPERPTEDMTALKNPARIVKLTEKGGKAHVVKIGALQALSQKTYIQREGDETIYLVQGDVHADLKKGLNDYRSKQVTGFQQTEAVRVEVTGQHAYALVKGGDKWVVESPIKSRADQAAVGNLVRVASSLYATKFVDDAPASLRPYGLETPRLVVAVTTETKTPRPPPPPPASAPAEPQFDIERRTYRIALGGTAEENVFARLDEPGSRAVFQIPEVNVKQMIVGLDDIRDKTVVDLNTSLAQKIALTSGGQRVELERKSGVWMIAGEVAPGASPRAEYAAVDDLLKTLRELKALSFEAAEAPNQGFAHPRAAVEVTLEGQVEPVRLTVGGLTGSQTGAYVRNDREGYVCVVKAESAEGLAAGPLTFLSRELVQFTRDRCMKIELAFPKYSVSVEKQAGTANWEFTSPVRGKAEFASVNAILSDLFNLRGRKVVGRRSEAGAFGLDDTAARVTLTVETPPIVKPATTAPGTSQPAGPPEAIPQPPSVHRLVINRKGDKVYAMTADGPTICEVDAKVLDDLLKELLDTQVTPVESSQARRLSLEGTARLALEKSGDRWALAGEPSFSVDETKVTAVFTALNELRAKEYVRYTGAKLADFGLDRPQVAVKAETSDGRLVELLISPTGPAAGGRYACVAATKDRVFVLTPEDVEKFNKKLQDFQK
jgi:hypothetical protein